MNSFSPNLTFLLHAGWQLIIAIIGCVTLSKCRSDGTQQFRANKHNSSLSSLGDYDRALLDGLYIIGLNGKFFKSSFDASRTVVGDDDSVTGIVENMGKDIYLLIRRQKMTLYLDTQENVRVVELKKMIEDILKVHPKDQQLFVLANDVLDECKELSDSTALFDCELNSATAKVIQPAVLGLAVQKEDGSFESLEITSYSESEWPKLSEIFSQEEEENAAFCEKYEKKYDELHDAKNNIPSKATS